MLFQTTDDRVKKLEKRMDSLEKQANKSLISINESLLTITEVVAKLQEENGSLKKEKNTLISRQKDVAKQIKDLSIKKDINDSIIEPVKNAVSENFGLIQEVTREGLTAQPSINDLLKLVEKEGEIKIQDAASKMKLHEVQIEHWSNILKDQKIISIIEKKNKKYLCKIMPAKEFRR